MEEQKKVYKNFEIGALWSRTSKDGKRYYSGSMDLDKLVQEYGFENGKISIVCFRNNYKKTDKHPDYKVLLRDEDYVAVKKKEKPEEEEVSIDDLFDD